MYIITNIVILIITLQPYFFIDFNLNTNHKNVIPKGKIIIIIKYDNEYSIR